MITGIFSHLHNRCKGCSGWSFRHYFLLILSLTILCSNNAAAQESPELTDTAKIKIQEEYGKLPLYFIQNDGQVDEKVKFYEKGSGRTTFFTKDGVTILLTNMKQPDSSSPNKIPAPVPSPTSESVKLTFLNANKNPEIIAEDVQEDEDNYFSSTDCDFDYTVDSSDNVIVTEQAENVEVVL